ncbi:DUF6766 family protein [Lysobacter arvi]|uniref:Transmembrane protein n=1 Tax=Lysobacter arvi TaxID=3038776 RepID=A0ABU1CBL7_9GAMM|nr:DUF6766 family protein [Lysobacter arvi]MDR0182162.1 hypothetical protein [Lysobacter arvi]
MREFLRNNGLSLVLLACLILPLIGQTLTGHEVYNDELVREGGAPLSLAQYLTSGHLVSSIFENWESEFLQMGMYVLLTVALRQKGSAESRPMSEPDEDEPTLEPGPKPWPVRVGGFWLTLYRHSLAIAFGLLFALSFVLHLSGSWRRELVDRALRGEGPIAMLDYLTEPEFWFESFQNWQSEFLAVLALVTLSIWLRQDGSPQSKPVEAPHSQTGT